MAGPKKSRGRPKGSGLDDSAHLDAMGKLMAAEPGLKPTTAIKKLGITDPSAVRRLRDKFHAQRRPARARVGAVSGKGALDRAGAAGSGRSTGSSPASLMASGRGAAERRQVRAVRRSSMRSSMGAEAADENSGVQTSSGEPQEWFAVWGGLGLQALAASVDFQLSMAGHAMRFPAVSAALRQQIFLNELAMSFCASPRSRSDTLH